MRDFRILRGFEDVWRPPVRPRRVTPEGGGFTSPNARVRLVRIVRRAPEVMVKITGRTRSADHLAAHLTYITRNGALPSEARDGGEFSGRRDVLDLAADWSAAHQFARGRRSNTPHSLSVILSMPEGTDPLQVRDAAHGFAREILGDRFDYVLVLHTDTGRPHVHLAIESLGSDGRRLNPKKADLQAWREAFAKALRDRGVDAEATPRRTRGVTRKAERTPLRKARERADAGRGPPLRIADAAVREAAHQAFSQAERQTP